MQKTGRIEWDIVTAYPEDLIAQSTVIETIDCSKLPSIASQAVEQACSHGGLLRTLGGVVIASNRAKLPKAPQTWRVFFDVERFPGPRAMPNAGAPWWPLMAALQADGVLKDSLFPLDLNRAFKTLDRLRPNISVWWRTGDQSQQLMRSGEVVLSMMWSGRAFALRDQGLPIDVVWNGAPPNTALWALVKGSKNTDSAMRFLDFFLTRPEAHLPFSEAVNFDTSNRLALEKLSAEQRMARVTAPEIASQLAPIDAQWVAANRAEVIERWNRWLSN